MEIWKYGNRNIKSKAKGLTPYSFFLNYIDDLKNGHTFSIFTNQTKESNNEEITLNEIIAFKEHLSKEFNNNHTILNYIYSIRQFLYFIQENRLTYISNGIFYCLNCCRRDSNNHIQSIPDEHLKKISILMKENASKNIEYALYYLCFYIGLETEFRSSQVFSLKKDCIVETGKKGEYVLVSKTKTSANKEIEQPVTSYLKSHIDDIIKLTDIYREVCVIKDISSYLFICTSQTKKGSYRVLGANTFNAYLKKCCDKVGIATYTFNNLRDTHMTKSEEFIIRNQLSDMEQRTLSGHKTINTDNKHYIDTPICNLLESVHGVIIGNINVDGQIKESLPPNITNKNNMVSNNCGFCRILSCNDFSFLDCMLCENFLTTIDRLPFFKTQIKILDEKIRNTTIPHDKEDLVNIKRLHLGFIKKILEIKAQKGDIENVTE
jgi:integrase